MSFKSDSIVQEGSMEALRTVKAYSPRLGAFRSQISFTLWDFNSSYSPSDSIVHLDDNYIRHPL